MIFLKGKSGIIAFDKKAGIIDYCNGFLLAFAVVAAIILAFSFRLGQRSATGALPFSKDSIGGVPEFKFVKKSVQYYERVLGRERLFMAQSGTTETDKPEPVQSGLQVSDLQLMGIVSGARGLQAIISEMKTEQSYYCYAGESIEGILIKEIYSDKVILERNGEKIELRL